LVAERSHRQARRDDERLFCPGNLPRLRAAVHDLSWLLGRGYAATSTLKLVGDRYELLARQRAAVSRCACGDAARERRARHEAAAADLRGRELLVDGYNLLTTVQVALAGGVVLRGRDGCYRDLASVHARARGMAEAIPAAERLGLSLEHLGAGTVTWYLDRPVSHSGALAAKLRDIAAAHGWDWRTRLVNDPDPILSRARDMVATSDSVILDRCEYWFGLARHVIDAEAPDAFVADLGAGP